MLNKILALGPPRGVLATTRFYRGEFGGQNETMWFWAKRGLTDTEKKGQLASRNDDRYALTCWINGELADAP